MNKLQSIVNLHAVKLEPSDWAARHQKAWDNPNATERGIKNIIKGYATLADSYASGHGMLLGEDGYFSEHARDMIQAMIAYLNFDCGRLDCGTLDRLIRELASESGVELPE